MIEKRGAILFHVKGVVNRLSLFVSWWYNGVMEIVLTPQQKQEAYDRKAKDFLEKVDSLSQECGMMFAPTFKFTPSAILTVLTVVPYDKADKGQSSV